MILHPALRYLILTRWKNRVGSILGKLRTLPGLLGGLLAVLAIVGLVFGARPGEDMNDAERAAVFFALLAFLMLTGVLSGIGQRGLVFLPADLDYLFPSPVSRRQLLLYHFVPHYLAAAFIGVIYLLVLGGRFMPNPTWFLIGFVLCQITNAHLGALAAELSMLVTDAVYARLRPFSTLITVGFVGAAMLLLIGGIAGLGDVLEHLDTLLGTPAARIVFFPAVKAVELSVQPDLAARLVALASLLACVAGSFLLVVLLRVDFVESSFAATKRTWKKFEQVRRGSYGGKVKRSAGGPRSPWFRGAGAVLWLNLLTMRRQLRAALGGLLVVAVMLAMFSRETRAPSLTGTILVMLAMVPLWMPLPVGFRLPREQLLVLRQLPLAPARLAGALLAVPVLVPFLLQLFAVIVLTVLGRLDVGLAAAALPAYVAAGVTMVAVESFFVLRRPHPNAINLLHTVAQILLQLAALLPGLVAAGVMQSLGASLPVAIFLGALVQAPAAYILARVLGARLQVGSVVGA